MDIESANKFLEKFEETKDVLIDRDKILYYSINLLKITYDIYDHLITLKFNSLSESLEKLSLEEAIIKANIIRIKHYIHSIIILSENSSNIETLQVLQRVHFESCVNLIYISKEKHLIKDRISSYMKKSLKDLKEMLNKELRPNELNNDYGQPQIANRIEKSIQEILIRIGIKETDITNNSSWGSFKSRFLDVMKGGNFYNLSYSSGSSPVHGNFDLVFKYYTQGNFNLGYSLNPFLKKNDFRVIESINSHNLMLIIHLVNIFLSKEDKDELKNLINSLVNINSYLIEKNEELLS